MQDDTRKRIWFWSLFLAAAIAVYIFGIYPRQHTLAQARQTVDILRPRLAADPRFAAVRISRATNGGVFIIGEVGSDSDLDALKQLVEKVNPPHPPEIGVHVSPTPK